MLAGVLSLFSLLMLEEAETLRAPQRRIDAMG